MDATARPGGAPRTTPARHRPVPDGRARPEGAGEAAWDVVTVPARQGLEAFDILRRGGAPDIGPVLHDGSRDTLGFLVPPGTAEGWDVPGSACTRTSGRGVRYADPAAAPEPPVSGSCWLLPPDPDTTGPVTDPAVLRDALGEAVRLIEVADNCC
ncbi:hypothetical protein NX801_19130 [Streptomyces sp. LP05-1]|uniref:Uncharacterized protein n=1 Tax=Streptomyces pyxinae TaxID=2970734 RepID=A0ABT2CKA6_9ACTN|nr:hypothetical protein [Streptomyces sp. LP05-1]MCS0637740.1 hypothetical protein [Streptomyces sp. LP05-1]